MDDSEPMYEVPGSRLRELTDQIAEQARTIGRLREALAQAIQHVEPVDQNSELAIAEWQALAAGRETVQPGQFRV